MRCSKAVPFDQLKGLHFCSMLIIRGADKSEPRCLVFEATFDGTREEFLDDLLRVAPEGIQAIYRHCDEYPTSGIEVPWLVKDYLLRHDAGANTFYSGSPGRSVAQILGEGQLRAAIANFIFDRRRSIPPNSLRDLQTELQVEVVRNHPDKRWAEQPSAVP